MCTLIVATGVWQAAPLVVAANRDEALKRPAEGPGLRMRQGVRILAPRDLEAGGTWLGLNGEGLFVGLTNRFGAGGRSGTRSRGLLVLDMLSRSTLDAALEALMQLSPERHNGFHLVLADQERAHLLVNDGQRHHHFELEPGVHVVTERSLGAAPTQRPGLVGREVRNLFGPSLPTSAAWAGLLRTRSAEPLEGICVNESTLDYGTRSSTIVQLGQRADQLKMLHSDGPPDVAVYDDCTLLLQRLLTRH